MNKLIRGIIQFRETRREGLAETFGRLALGQKPDALFISTQNEHGFERVLRQAREVLGGVQVLGAAMPGSPWTRVGRTVRLASAWQPTPRQAVRQIRRASRGIHAVLLLCPVMV